MVHFEQLQLYDATIAINLTREEAMADFKRQRNDSKITAAPLPSNRHENCSFNPLCGRAVSKHQSYHHNFTAVRFTERLGP
jgi:hypothetical protein